jgi:hypothetical protein
VIKIGFFMRISESSRPQSRRRREVRASSPASLLSTLLLAVILVTGSCVLGGVRPWIELPILGGVALLLLIQAVRLAAPSPIGSLRQIDAIDLCVVLFALYAVARWLTSPTEFFSRFEALEVIGYAVVFFFCRYGLSQRIYGVALIILLAVLGVGEVAFGYLLHLHSNAGDPPSLWFPFGATEQMHIFWAPRWLGTYGCPNHYASLLVMAAGAALALGCFSRFAWPLRIVFFYSIVILLVGILYSESRGSWLSLVGALAALTLFGLRYGTLRWWIPVAGLTVMVAILGTIFVSSRVVKHRVADMTERIEGGELNKYLRVQLTLDALHIARDYPVFGTGPATYIFMDPRYQGNSLDVRAVFTHDDYLNCLDDYGLVGFALAMFFVFAVTLALWGRIGGDSTWHDRVLVAAGLAAWTALLVHSFLDFNLHIPANAMMLFALTGLALRRSPAEDAPAHWSTISLVSCRRPLSWGLAIFSLLYGAEVVRTALSDIPYEMALGRAEIAPTIQSIRGVEQALAFDSDNAQALTLLGDLHRVRATRAENNDDRMDESQQSVDAYQRALRANPLDDNIRARMGLTYDLMQKYPEAYRCYHAAVTAQPYNGEFWTALGAHFLHRGLLAEAEQAYLTAAKCPYGNIGAMDSARKVRSLLDLDSFLPPTATDSSLPPPGNEDRATPP